jgi:hypothetical protein
VLVKPREIEPSTYASTNAAPFGIIAARQSPPYGYRGSRNGNRPAGYASRERECPCRIVAPSRRDRHLCHLRRHEVTPQRAQLDIGTRGTRRSRVAPRRGGTRRLGEHGQPPQPRVSSAGRVRISSNRVCGIGHHAAVQKPDAKKRDRALGSLLIGTHNRVARQST